MDLKIIYEVPFAMFQRIMEETGYDLGATPDVVIDTLPTQFGGHWVDDEWLAIEFDSEKECNWFILRWS